MGAPPLPAVPPDYNSSLVAPVPSPPQPPSPAKRVLVSLLVFVGSALALVKAFVWSGGTWNAEVCGYALGGLLLPLLIAYGIAGRKKNRRPVAFGLIFLGISLASLLLELSHHRSPQAEVAAIAREVTGASPANSRGDSPQDRLLREVMTEFLQQAKAHNEKVRELDSGLQNLYAPASFYSPEAMSLTRDSVQKITTLDHEFVLEFEQWPSRVREQTAQSGLSEADKQAFLKGFAETSSNSDIFALRRQIDTIEAGWCKDTRALYDFAQSRSARIHVRGAHILIDDENTRTRFNDLLHQSREEHQRIREMNAQLAKLQEAGLQTFGLTKKDIGSAR